MERITIGLDVRNELSPELNKAGKDVRKFEAVVEDAGRALDKTGKDADGLKASTAAAGAGAAAAGQKMRGAVGDVDRLGRALTEADVAAGRYVDKAGRVREANGKFAQGFTKAADAAEESATRQKTAFGIMSSSWQEHGSQIAATSTLVAAALTFGTWKATNLAAQAEQNLGAVEAVFKDHADGMIANSEKASEALGLTSSEYLQFSARLGAQFKGMGMPIGDAATNADALIAKGADLAAMFGTTVPESVDALSALLRGEMDPAERLGITLRAEDVELKMKEMGTSGATGEAEKLAKAQATLALINEQTADATGQYSRELDTAAGSMAAARAEWGEAMLNFGAVFLPLMAEGAKAVKEFSEILAAHPKLTAAVVVGVVAIGAALAGLWGLTVAIRGFQTLRDTFREIAAARAEKAISRAGDAAAKSGAKAQATALGKGGKDLDPAVAKTLRGRDAETILEAPRTRTARQRGATAAQTVKGAAVSGLTLTPFATRLDPEDTPARPPRRSLRERGASAASTVKSAAVAGVSLTPFAKSLDQAETSTTKASRKLRDIPSVVDKTTGPLLGMAEGFASGQDVTTTLVEDGLGGFADQLGESEGKLGKVASAAGKAVGAFAAFQVGLELLDQLLPKQEIGADVIANAAKAGPEGLAQQDQNFAGAKWANENGGFERHLRGSIGGIDSASDAVEASATAPWWAEAETFINPLTALGSAREDIAALDSELAALAADNPAGAAEMFRHYSAGAVAAKGEEAAMEEFPQYRAALLADAPPALNPDQIKALMFTGSPGMAAGGIVPGPLTPGRDTSLWSTPLPGLPTLALSGFESILRPEATAELGTAWVHRINGAARSGGRSAVRRALTPTSHPGAATGAVIASHGPVAPASLGAVAAPQAAGYVDQRTFVEVDARGAQDPQAVGAAVVEAIIEAREEDQRRRNY